MHSFKAYHPIVNFIYFLFVIGFSMLFINPVCLAISLVCSFLFSVTLIGKAAYERNLRFIIPMLIAAAIINPAFNHQGVTVITFLPSGNPITLESVFYGIAAGAMIACVISWFLCYNEVMTSDKFIYLFGRVIPSLSLLFSMILRFVPMFAESLKETAKAQKCLGHDISKGSIGTRAKVGLSILSATITRFLESSVDTADSMRARGWGLRGRTSFSIFKFTTSDFFALIWILALGTYIGIRAVSGKISFTFFPAISALSKTLDSLFVYSAYFALFITPVIIEIWEGYKWKKLK
mgnify:CR=1 FL=1